jgi:hypothetical protein
MLRAICACAILTLAIGCTPAIVPGHGAESDSMFGPVLMKIDPIFTKITDWTGDGKPDGIDVSIGFEDRFEDPTKAAGRMMFELYEYRREDPDAHGKRLTNPWIGPIDTVAQQKAHWFATGRTYNFQLEYRDIKFNSNYVLMVQFDRASGGRFFDKIILAGDHPKEIQRVQPASLPGSTPGGRTPQP